ncbi:hypothetical protein MRX96_014419 [Rhipicephalus microplus]
MTSCRASRAQRETQYEDWSDDMDDDVTAAPEDRDESAEYLDLQKELDSLSPWRPSTAPGQIKISGGTRPGQLPQAMSRSAVAPGLVPLLDPGVIFPDHFQRGRIPLTFPSD